MPKPRYTEEHAEAGLDHEFPEIETWPNQFPGYEIVVDDPEFTSVCPKTGLPDFGILTIRYMPDKKCLELKSLKEYLQSYRNLGIFQENIVNRVLEDVVRWAKPVWAEIKGDFRPRGGISTVVVARWPTPKTLNRHPERRRTSQRGLPAESKDRYERSEAEPRYSNVVQNASSWNRKVLRLRTLFVPKVALRMTGSGSCSFKSLHVIFLPQVTQRKLYPWTALVILTTLNFLNYIDRSVLFAVQPLVQSEFKLTNTQVGYLTSAFLLFYMVAAPFVGPLADRYSRKLIIAGSGVLERADFDDCSHPYIWRVVVPPYTGGSWRGDICDHRAHFCRRSFSGKKTRPNFRNFLSGDSCRHCSGLSLGGRLGPAHGWRFPFYIAAFPASCWRWQSGFFRSRREASSIR